MGVFQYEKVKDPTYYGENRVPAHSDHRYYGSVEEMEQSLGTKVRVLPVDGGAFCDAIFPWEE